MVHNGEFKRLGKKKLRKILVTCGTWDICVKVKRTLWDAQPCKIHMRNAKGESILKNLSDAEGCGARAW